VKSIFAFFVTVFFVFSSLLGATDKLDYSTKKVPARYVPGQVIVKFKKSFIDPQSALHKRVATAGVVIESANPLFISGQRVSNPLEKKAGLDRIYKLEISQQIDIEKYCQKLMRTGLVEYAEPVYIVPVEAVPNDSLYDQLWHLPQIHAPEAWDIAKGDSSVIIAIIDTGVDWDHPDLAASIWRNEDEVEDGTDTDGNGYIDDIRGWDFVDNIDDYAAGEDGIVEDNNPMDFDGHGTFVAGLAAAATDNAIGVSSISWGCRIMPLRAGYHSASGGWIDLSFAAKAFKYAADNGANVINLSTASSQVLVDVARYAFEKGVVIVKSAGNENRNDPDPLELEPYVISVAAVDDQDKKASYSDYGPWVTVSAPGGDVSRGRPGLTSTAFNDTYSSFQGTSYASPIVAGLAGLLKSAYPELTPADIIFQIVETADDIYAQNPAYSGRLGSGRINAFRALTESVTPAPDFQIASVRVDDALQGNGNNLLDPGERVKIYVTLKNNWGDARNVSASISVNNQPVVLEKDMAVFPDIPGLSDIAQNTVENSEDPFIVSVDQNVLPQRVTMHLSVRSEGHAEQEMTFLLPISPSVLLVDDDGEGINVESYYTVALEEIGVAYDYWNRTEKGAPGDVMNQYSTVIWFCEGAFPTLDSLDRAAIASYLDHSGHLFISGQDIGWDLCDVNASDEENEYFLSGGTSKAFYEQYLRAQYLNDDSGLSHLLGVDGDPIFDGMEFDFDQPGRDIYRQWPSEIRPLSGAEVILQYPNGRAAAIKYSDGYRLVYFAFGGFEAIKLEQTRLQVLPRILNWLNGVSLQFELLPNTEDTNNDYPVTVHVQSEISPIESVDVYWKREEQVEYHRVSMKGISDSIYQALIPAQNSGVIDYAIVAHLQNGYTTPVKVYNFRVGPDKTPPEISVLSAPRASLYKENIKFVIRAADDIGVDSSTVFFHFSSAKMQEDSLLMLPDSLGEAFTALLPDRFFFGDDVYYYFSVQDKSLAHNRSVTGVDTLTIGLEDFENGLTAWDVVSGTWGTDYSQHHSGHYSLNDTPMSDIISGQTFIIRPLKPFDFSKHEEYALSFYTMYFLRDQKDFGYFEGRTAGDTNWVVLAGPITGVADNWYEVDVPVDQLIGQDSVYFRFRLETDPQLTFGQSGWYIDDFQIQEIVSNSVHLLAHEKQAPKRFHLAQNYPNPFNPTTTIEYDLPQESDIELMIYNSVGQKIRTLIRSHQPAGSYMLQWDGTDDYGHPVSAGIYLIRMKANDFVSIKKMALVR